MLFSNWKTNNYNKHLPNISRSKTNQLMKFGQFEVGNVRNVFLKNHTENVRQCETGPRPLSIKSKLRISLDQQSKVSHSTKAMFTLKLIMIMPYLAKTRSIIGDHSQLKFNRLKLVIDTLEIGVKCAQS